VKIAASGRRNPSVRLSRGRCCHGRQATDCPMDVRPDSRSCPSQSSRHCGRSSTVFGDGVLEWWIPHYSPDRDTDNTVSLMRTQKNGIGRKSRRTLARLCTVGDGH